MSNEKLVQLIRDGDRQLELWEQIRRFAMKTANRWLTALPLRYDIEFDNLMSAAYIAMCEAASTYKAERGAFTTWYRGIVITLKQLTRHCTASERQTTPNEIKSMEGRGLRAMQCNARLRGFNCYSGTGLSSFRRTGASIQENYLLFAENAQKCTHKKSGDFSAKILQERQGFLLPL